MATRETSRSPSREATAPNKQQKAPDLHRCGCDLLHASPTVLAAVIVERAVPHDPQLTA